MFHVCILRVACDCFIVVLNQGSLTKRRNNVRKLRSIKKQVEHVNMSVTSFLIYSSVFIFAFTVCGLIYENL